VDPAAGSASREWHISLRRARLHRLALALTRSPDQYVPKINGALDQFARKRRLWGPSNSYRAFDASRFRDGRSPRLSKLTVPEDRILSTLQSSGGMPLPGL
jgi:hypothetical protein